MSSLVYYKHGYSPTEAGDPDASAKMMAPHSPSLRAGGAGRGGECLVGRVLGWRISEILSRLLEKPQVLRQGCPYTYEFGFSISHPPRRAPVPQERAGRLHFYSLELKKVLEIICHPKYNDSLSVSASADIALPRLTASALLSEHILLSLSQLPPGLFSRG